jgi:hypothetical protein
MLFLLSVIAIALVLIVIANPVTRWYLQVGFITIMGSILLGLLGYGLFWGVAGAIYALINYPMSILGFIGLFIGLAVFARGFYWIAGKFGAILDKYLKSKLPKPLLDCLKLVLGACLYAFYVSIPIAIWVVIDVYV